MTRLWIAGFAFAAATLGPAAAAEPLLVGVFAGTLPCADCTGIATELTLVRKADGWAEGRYLLRRAYQGRAGQPLITTGEWTTLRGDARDPDAVVYELDPDFPTKASHFLKRGEGSVQALDRDLKPIRAGRTTTLTRRTRNLPDPATVNCLRRGGMPGPTGACVGGAP